MPTLPWHAVCSTSRLHANPHPPLTLTLTWLGRGTHSKTAPLTEVRLRFGASPAKENLLRKFRTFPPKKEGRHFVPPTPYAKKESLFSGSFAAKGLQWGMQEYRPDEILRTEEPSAAELGPKLRALLLAQPLNGLRPLKFRELPSRNREAFESISLGAIEEVSQAK